MGESPGVTSQGRWYKYRSSIDAAGRARAPRLKNYFDVRGMRILKALDNVSDRLSTRPASVALAWLMARPGLTSPIASATSIEQLADLVTATTLDLDRAAVEELDLASAP